MKKIIDLPTHFENEFISIKYLPEKKYIAEVWKDFGEDSQIKFVKNKFTEIIKNTKANLYLSDITNFKGASPEIQRWVRDVWFAQVYTAGLRSVAIVVTQDIFANFSVKTAISGDYAKKMNIQKFVSYEEAEKWLQEI